MSWIRKILVPIDLSDCSKKALKYAIALGVRYRARLFILTCNEGYVMGPELIKGDLPPDSRKAQGLLELIEARSRKETEERLSRFLEDLHLEELGLEVETVVAQETPYVEIVRQAKEQDVDLIVLGTQGRHGLGRVLLGSTTEKVVQLAHCAVMTVRGGGS